MDDRQRASIGKDRALEVAVQDPQDVWNVSEVAVEIAERLETRMTPMALDLEDPPVDSWHCVAPQTHPELFPSPPRT